ncbi:MAG: molybdate ABC transporter substrate-binding protein [candidate division NC10 bacterium RBG_16_65_8]|nr:MAG: molybdate ABC transporter substrate-binding protein [candidate division NC10 bacterium RBG_16_65_8]
MTVRALTCLLGLWLLAVPRSGLAGQDSPPQTRPELVVAAAADLVFAFREIVPAFERGHRVRVTLSLGSTGQLTRQIEHGAPFDVFFAANMDFVDGLRQKGHVRPESVEPYAQGLIVLAWHTSRPPLARLDDLTKNTVARLAIANPAHAPYGMAAKEALASAGLWERIRPKLVYGENINQALQFLRTENVDAAILALSVAQVPEVRSISIDRGLYRPLVQGVAVTTRAREPDMARAFIRFVNGREGRPIMKRFGFLLPGEF